MIAVIIAIAVIAAGQTEAFTKIVGQKSVMFLCVMIFVPIAALILKHTEKFWIHRIKSGFEMLVNNFYLGFLGFALIFPSFYLSIYLIGYIQLGLKLLVEIMQQYKLYPIAAIVIEPAKVLFLNNAINHGVLTPLGLQQVRDSGKSILFLLESNPGPGLGLLVAFLIFFFKRDKKLSSNAASSGPIHLFGGIHEVYFPFVLLKPVLILATIAGGVVGNGILQIFNAGTIAPVSPGSVIAGFLQINKTPLDVAGYALALVLSAVTSLLISLLLLSLTRKKQLKTLQEAQAQVAEMKQTPAKKPRQKDTPAIATKIDFSQVTFVCDAGMGSSTMGAAIFRKELKNQNIEDITVINKAIVDLKDEKVIITISQLYDRVKAKRADATIYTINQFLDKQGYLTIIEKIKNEKN
ncbi:PTS mannitol transporter subunit IICB [Mycoplasmoides pneumoniae]|uniref:PTS system mannitol-specific (MtlA)-like IIB domain protein n=2 Tax=Mycoplasmoides pneumoniae TaxID=2104 RepID=A0AB38W5J1_MYCPM|nr:PTS mannitol transporter subunit IICB [Mycoplasmoides pneumoniae]GLL57385.1 PTS system mannitol-specific EIICB component [Mycoplasmoides pneumoniae]GLL58820.1 PTS system mannitol-specific EIICB component [Mycoplasmoides pneumoniae]GLL59585.1 PTS system mannitol-specific EIICB component [Mycoplasmoides pneumoniae]VEU56787.1 PTS system mannitol-specific (MtlA)-like IIB domain protein [Mycoplasmoides pneumoniae]